MNKREIGRLEKKLTKVLQGVLDADPDADGLLIESLFVVEHEGHEESQPGFISFNVVDSNVPYMSMGSVADMVLVLGVEREATKVSVGWDFKNYEANGPLITIEGVDIKKLGERLKGKK